MSRNMHGSIPAQLAAAQVKVAYLFEGVFSGTFRLSSIHKDIVWDSKTWNGNGWLQGIGDLREADDLGIERCEISLAGVPSAVVSAILSANRPYSGKVYFAVLDNAYQVIGNAIEMFSGKLDTPRISEDADGMTVQLVYESDMVAFDRPEEFRYTQETQKNFFSGDLGFEYVTSADKWEGWWGQTRRELKRRKKRRERREKNRGR